MTQTKYLTVLTALLFAARTKDKSTGAPIDRESAMRDVTEHTDAVVSEAYPEIRGANYAVVYSARDDTETAAFFSELLEFDLDFRMEGLHVFRLPSGQAFDVYANHPDGSSGHLKFGLAVTDIVLDRQRAEARGGVFVEELAGSMEGVAAWEFVRDPDGNQIQLGVDLSDPAQKITVDQGSKSLKIKGMSWLGYNAADLGDTTAFYDDVLGAQQFTVSDSADQKLLQSPDGVYLSITHAESDLAVPADQLVVGFEVDDLATSVDVIKSRGIELIGEQERRDGLSWQYFKGPEGLVFKLVAVTTQT